MNLQFSPRFGLEWPQGFELDPSSQEAGGDLEPTVLLHMLTQRDEAITDETNMLLSHALMLFSKLSTDSTYNGVTPDQLFAACCDTVLIWCDG